MRLRSVVVIRFRSVVMTRLRSIVMNVTLDFLDISVVCSSKWLVYTCKLPPDIGATFLI